MGSHKVCQGKSKVNTINTAFIQMSHIISAGCKTVKMKMTADKAWDFFKGLINIFGPCKIILLKSYRENSIVTYFPYSQYCILCQFWQSTKHQGAETQLAKNHCEKNWPWFGTC